MAESREPSKQKRRRGYAAIPAIDPRDGGQWDVLVAHSRMDAIAKRGPGHARELAFAVPFVLLRPTAIFRGVREEDELEWLCYCGTPQFAYDGATGETRAPWKNQVFLVFVTADRVVYNWRWEPCDPRRKDLPAGYALRFKERAL